MDGFLWFYAIVMIPLISVVDGGYIGWFFSMGNPVGVLVGIFGTAALMYGFLIHTVNHDVL